VKTRAENLGFVRVMPAEAVTHPEFGLSAQEREDRESDRFLEILGLKSVDSTPSSLGCLQVDCAILRGDQYVVEASTPGENVMIRFAPSRPLDGHYEIRCPSKHPTEKGVTSTVKRIPEKVLDPINPVIAALSGFTHRFIVITLSGDRSRTRKGWIIAVRSFQSVVDTQNESVSTQHQ
jgi:hypothetical protein